ncbi:unnamed protein product [Meloidogyne enterolobii]|uniref:Uncharacterized protein n=1 Tax=Meloidogyne enterolobii TaxID=390850 RepID=A0ACB0YV08_MELEN
MVYSKLYIKQKRGAIVLPKKSITEKRKKCFFRYLERYIPITNKINEISNYFTCCGDKCINSNFSNGTCNKGQSFIRVKDNGIVNYHSVHDKDVVIGFHGQYSFTKAAGFCCHYSLFYFEITMLEDVKDKFCYAAIGFSRGGTPLMFMSNYPITYTGLYQKSSWKDGDVFGCGVVFPPKKESKILPYIFITKNGRRTGENFYFLVDFWIGRAKNCKN